MKIFALEYDIAWEDRAANLATVQRLAAQAAPPAGSLLVLPEMALTGTTCVSRRFFARLRVGARRWWS